MMVDAIAQTVEQTEDEAAFHQLALDRQSEMTRTGRFIEWNDLKTWGVAKAAGKPVKRPVIRNRSR